MRAHNANFIIEKNKRAPDGPTPINLVTINFSTPVYFSDRDITPSGGPAHKGLIKEWGFIDSQVPLTPGGSLLDKIQSADFYMTVINMESPSFSANFSEDDPLENCLVEVFQWFDGTLYSEKETIFKGFITGVSPYNLYECKLIVKGYFEKYNKLIGEDLIVRAADHPDAAPDDIGKMLPLAWGTCTRAPFRCIEAGGISLLSAGIDDSAESITISNVNGFGPSGVVLMGTEKIYYSSISTKTLTGCSRGYLGTTPAAHNIGEKVYYIPFRLIFALGCAIKSFNAIYSKAPSSNLFLELNSDEYIACTGQSGNAHSEYPGKAIIEFTSPKWLPQGIIVPFSGSEAPDGWSMYNNDNRFPIAAGNSYPVQSTGGAADGVTFNYASNEYTHLGDPFDIGYKNVEGYHPFIPTPGIAANDTTYFNQSHTHDMSCRWLPRLQNLRFIQLDDFGITVFPTNAVVMTKINDTPLGLSSCYENNALLRGADSITSDDENIDNITCSTDGEHHFTCII